VSFIDDIIEWGSGNSFHGIKTQEEIKRREVDDRIGRMAAKDAADRAAYDQGQNNRLAGKADNSEGRDIYGAQSDRDYARQGKTIGELGNSYDIAKRAAAGQDVNAQAAEARARQQQADQMRTNYALAASVPMARRAAMQRTAGNQTGASQAALNNSIMNSNAAFQGASRDRMGDINDARMRAAVEARGQSMGADEYQSQLNQNRNQFYEGQLLDREASGIESMDRGQERTNAAARAKEEQGDREDAAVLNTVGTVGGGVLGAAVGGPAGAAVGAGLGGSASKTFGKGPNSDPKLKYDMKELTDRHFAKMAMRGR
jgi:hypothetical protein